jgi:putative lipoprotein
MKNKKLMLIIFISVFTCLNLNAYEINSDVFRKEKNNTIKEKVDCDDPKNRPNYIGGVMISGKKECLVNSGSKEKVKRSFDGTIGRNPVTGKVTSKAELAGANNPTMNLETAQMNFGKKKVELEEAEKVYKDDASVKNSRRVDKARKAFKQAQLDLEAAEEIKEKADRKKDK